MLTAAILVAGTVALVPAKVEAAYGMAGCGIGAIVFQGDNTMWKQLINAAFLNNLLGSQTLGITSGTSECSDNGVIKAEVEQKVYAFNNFDNLRQEMAQGQGEKLTSFAYLLGCDSNAVSTFSDMTQKNIEQIFPEGATPESMLNEVKSLSKVQPELANSCTRL